MTKTIKVNSFAGTGGYEYQLKYEWKDVSVQAGAKGIVFVAGGENYTTAFFEAFPKEPSCFIRGEGADVEIAEKEAWEKYLKIQDCVHEMERRDRTDGYGYCKHCSYASTVFEPLTKCCHCKTPTAYTSDYKGKYYCKRHRRFKRRNPNPSIWESHHRNQRLPRKLKKRFKEYAEMAFWQNNIFGKITYQDGFTIKFICNGASINLLTESSKRRFKKQGLSIHYKNKRIKRRTGFDILKHVRQIHKSKHNYILTTK